MLSALKKNQNATTAQKNPHKQTKIKNQPLPPPNKPHILLFVKVDVDVAE